MTGPTVHVLFYRACGHVIVAVGDRSVADAVAAKVTGVSVRVASDNDLAALMTRRPRRCLCRVRDRSILAAWHRAVVARRET